MILRWFCAAAALMASAPWALAGAAARLSIFIQDNHAASFGWIARHAPLDTPHVLVLTDASGVAVGIDDVLCTCEPAVPAHHERAKAWR